MNEWIVNNIPGNIVYISDEVSDSVSLGDGGSLHFRMEHRCPTCGHQDVVIHLSPEGRTTLIFDGKCKACDRKEEYALMASGKCPTCISIKLNHKGFGPSHEGSVRCQSGSLAAGGRYAHCSCDTCF